MMTIDRISAELAGQAFLMSFLITFVNFMSRLERSLFKAAIRMFHSRDALPPHPPFTNA
jgi:hypothetical protein